MNPRLKKRMTRLGSSPLSAAPLPTSRSPMESASSSAFEVRNEAALLLSLSDIVNREVQQTSGGLQGLWHDDDDDEDSSSSNSITGLPKFPRLALTVSKSYDDESTDDSDDYSNEGHHQHFNKKMKMDTTVTTTKTSLGFLKPRCEMYPSASSTTTNSRLRSVSIDSPRLLSSNNHNAAHMALRIASPISLSAIHAGTSSTTSRLVVSPVTPRSPRSPRRHSSCSSGQGKSLKVQHPAGSKKTPNHHLVTPPASNHRPVVVGVGVASKHSSSCPKKGQELQGPVPNKKGITIKTISRKKFSWKNYPELEAFLIDNREEYLHFSALNYTIQQKQYNNNLTCQLLELATQHGYLFDVTEFSFVTVRDRIRCYFKSYVQSAKKRGVLMGYAARKAGLLLSNPAVREKGSSNLIMAP